MAKKTDEQDEPTENTEAKSAGIRLAYAGEGSPGDLLSIGEVHYDVIDHIVYVAPEHLEAALQAGFRHA